MHFEFLSNVLPLRGFANKDTGTSKRIGNVLTGEEPNQSDFFGFKWLGCSLLSIIPGDFKGNKKTQAPPTINRELKRRAQHPSNIDSRLGETCRLRFRPYVSKVPWHTGARAFLSQLFPRYGHYCGPNWSSGKDGGSLIWDKRPIDWLDFCCYCHDMGYDSHDQADLLKADLAFLDCLERPNMSTKGDAHVALVYKKDHVHHRPQEYIDTVQEAIDWHAVRTTIDSVRMVEQYELERMEGTQQCQCIMRLKILNKTKG